MHLYTYTQCLNAQISANKARYGVFLPLWSDSTCPAGIRHRIVQHVPRLILAEHAQPAAMPPVFTARLRVMVRLAQDAFRVCHLWLHRVHGAFQGVVDLVFARRISHR